MANTKSKVNVTVFDIAQHLDDEVAIANYMTAILEMNDPDVLLAALNTVARAKRWLRVQSRDLKLSLQ